MRWGVALLLLLLAGCFAGHDVVIVIDFSGAGSLVVTRPGANAGPEQGTGVTAQPARPSPDR